MRQPDLRDVPGVLSSEQLHATVASIAAAQQPSGSVPWPDGHTDAWDHVECAMALTLGGRFDEARAAYDWLVRNQSEDNSWAMSYDEDHILDSSVDTNQCAYIAVGAWQWWLITADSSLPLFPLAKRSPSLRFRRRTATSKRCDCVGKIPGRHDQRGALLTGSASTYQALRCGWRLRISSGNRSRRGNRRRAPQARGIRTP